MERDLRAAAPVLARLADTLRVLAEDRAPGWGKLALLNNGGVSKVSSPAQLVLDRALDDLAEAAGRDDRIAAAWGCLADGLHARAVAVAPRGGGYGPVHGELGPDHVLVDAAGEPVLIDIEGLMHFDVEWEHVILRIRFGDHYPSLGGTEGLDRHRLDLYGLTIRLSLVAGPLRLLDGDFPHRAVMREIAEYNLTAALALVE
ncbi:aminoglycoside phosphotransferase family protein [Kitasatospora purpeofusca]|uniref:aminoglycoside phosphotransferase family protein n=1 Tax=Kitasatospora purpeofusca TaxID=67352 RepID=UPI003F4AB464